MHLEKEKKKLNPPELESKTAVNWNSGTIKRQSFLFVQKDETVHKTLNVFGIELHL